MDHGLGAGIGIHAGSRLSFNWLGSLLQFTAGQLWNQHPQSTVWSFDPAHGTYVNIVAIIIVLLITWMLSFGMTSSVRVNNIAIAIKIAIIVAFIVVGAFFIKKANYQPFLPYGMHGVFKGATTVFFAFWALTVSQAQLPKSRIRKRTCQSELSGHFWSLPCFTWAFQSS